MKVDYLTALPPHWEPIARIFAALGDDTRQKILLMFDREEELSIKMIAESLPQSRTAIVHHLSVLERAGIVAARKTGRSVLYRMCPEAVQSALEHVSDYIKEELL